MVKSNAIYSPQEYVGGITGNCFISKCDGTVKCIRQHLERYGFDDLWDYPLTEINHIVENDLNVVLVDCSHYEGDSYINEYRWFEVPEDFVDEYA